MKIKKLTLEQVVLDPQEVEQLLLDLCVKFGFCLAPPLNKRLINNPPRDAERFAEVVCQAEGLDLKLRSDSYYMVQNYIAATFQQHVAKAAS